MRKSTNYIGGLILLGIMFACNKDKLRTRPSLKLNSVTNRVVPVDGQSPLIVEFDYADKEGDLASLFVQKIRLNQRVMDTNGRDTFPLVIPRLDVTKTDGQIELKLLPVDLDMANMPVEPDTMEIRFALRDRAGNVSDTVSIGQVVQIR